MNDNQKEIGGGVMLGLMIAVAVSIACLFAGCGTCRTPMQRAERHGMVLECHPGAKVGTATCKVSTKDGDKEYTYRRSCE